MQTNNINFIPLDREIMLHPEKTMICKYTPNGLIEYVNDYFVEMSGFEAHELVGNSIDTLKHSELPLTVYNHIMEHVKEGKNIHAIIKDLTRDGRYYWFYTDFEFKKDENGVIRSFLNYRRAAPRIVLPDIEKFYQKLLKIEQNSTLLIAKKYFDGFNEENGMTFSEYTKSIIIEYGGSLASPKINNLPTEQTISQEKKSFFSKVFKK